MDAVKLGKFIQGQRKNQGLTQAQLAEKICVTDKAVSKWERGIGIPDISNIEALAIALNLFFSEIMQCKRMEENLMNDDTVNLVVDETIHLLSKEKRRFVKRCIIFSAIIITGISLVLVAINYMCMPFSLILNDGGANSTFISGQMPVQIVGGMLAAGSILLITSLVSMAMSILKRKKRGKKS